MWGGRPRLPALFPTHIHRHDQRDVGQVGAAAERIVEHNDVARLRRALFYGGGYRHGHGAEVHRHVITHCDDLAERVEHGAGVIAALLYIGRKRSAAQRSPHFFGNGVVEVLEDLEFDGIAHCVECTADCGKEVKSQKLGKLRFRTGEKAWTTGDTGGHGVPKRA